MCIEQFAEEVCSELKKMLPPDYKVEQKVITKNNDTKFHAVLVSGIGDTLVPTFYLEDYYNCSKQGGNALETAQAIYNVYMQQTPKGKVCFDWFENFDAVKDKICYKLINKNANRRLLEDIPYIDFLDLALCFFVIYRDNQIGDGTILVRNVFLNSWNVSVTDLVHAAEHNTPRYYPAVIQSIADILAGMKDTEIDVPEDACLDVLTNSEKTFGAAAMLYPKLLSQYSEKIGGGYYIIPSSVHEVLLLPDTGIEDAAKLREMIAEVNNTQLEQQEILSYNVYYYDSDNSRVIIMQSNV